MNQYTRAILIGLTAGPIVVLLACYAQPVCALGFTAAILSSMLIHAAKRLSP